MVLIPIPRRALCHTFLGYLGTDRSTLPHETACFLTRPQETQAASRRSINDVALGRLYCTVTDQGLPGFQLRE